MEQAKLKVCRQKASVSDPRCQAATAPASGRPFSPALLPPVVPGGLVSLFFLAGSGMMSEVELTCCYSFCKLSSSRLLVVPHPLLFPPWVLALWAKDVVFWHFPCISGSRWGPLPGPLLSPVVPRQNLGGSPWKPSPEMEVFPVWRMRRFIVLLAFKWKARWEQMQGSMGPGDQGLRRCSLRAGNPYPGSSAFPWSHRRSGRQPFRPPAERSCGRGLHPGSTAGHLPFALCSESEAGGCPTCTTARGPNISQQLGISPH